VPGADGSSYATYAIPQGAERVSETGSSASYGQLAVGAANTSMEPENYAGLPPYSQLNENRFDKYKADF
jgi:hypothetical protein